MGKELEETVQELMKTKTKRSQASSLYNHFDAKVSKLEKDVSDKLKAGQIMPNDSKLFAMNVEVVRGNNFGTYTRAVKIFKDKYPQYADVFNKIFKQVEKEEVPKLKYGYKKDLEK